VCHRLDVGTSGALILARSSAAAASCSADLRSGDVISKTYKLLTSEPVSLGRRRHFIFNGPFNTPVDTLGGVVVPRRGPRLISRVEHKGWKSCELEVLGCVAADGAVREWCQNCGVSGTTERAGVQSSGAAASGARAVYETTVRLITGRTHQIRAQLAACGNPIFGVQKFATHMCECLRIANMAAFGFAPYRHLLPTMDFPRCGLQVIPCTRP